MELPEETFHDIHQYLSGGGTPEARTDFEKRMRADAALAREVEVQRRIRNGLKANEYKSLFKDIHAELQNDGMLPAGDNTGEPGTTIPLNRDDRPAVRWPYIAAAASVLIAIGLVWYFNSLRQAKPVASDIPATEKSAETDTINVKQALPAAKPDTVKAPPPQEQKKPQTPPANVDKTDFFAAYFDEKVELDSPFSKEKLGLSPSAFKQWQSDTAHVRQGVRLLAARASETALQELKQAETSRFPQVKSAAEWYMALVYLQRKDLRNCVEQLEKVAADPENQNSKQAAELLTKIQ